MSAQFYTVRTLLVLFIIILSQIIPSLNVLLMIAGSILGTIVTIVIPVMFYNKAYGKRNSKKPRTSSNAGPFVPYEVSGNKKFSFHKDPNYNNSDSSDLISDWLNNSQDNDRDQSYSNFKNLINFSREPTPMNASFRNSAVRRTESVKNG